MKCEKTSLSEKCIVAVSAVILTWVFFKYLLPPLVPVIVSAILSSFMRPIVKFVSARSKMSLKICGGVIIALLIFAISYSAVYLGGKLLREASDFLSVIATELEKEDNIIRRALDILKSLPEKFPFLKGFASEGTGFGDEVYSFVISSAREAAGKLSSGVTSAAAGFIKSLPSFVFSMVVSVLALFYLTIDSPGVRSAVKQLLPQGIRVTVKNLSEGISGGIIGYVRAYFVLMALTFSAAFLGLVILDVRYAFFLAIMIAVIDALPILGSGSVTLPWGIFSLITGNTSRGIGLLILTAIMYILRQLAEPRLVGHFLGIHPLLTLIAAYLGFSFFGFYGMIVAPVCLYVVRIAISDNSAVSNDEISTYRIRDQ